MFSGQFGVYQMLCVLYSIVICLFKISNFQPCNRDEMIINWGIHKGTVRILTIPYGIFRPKKKHLGYWEIWLASLELHSMRAILMGKIGRTTSYKLIGQLHTAECVRSQVRSQSVMKNLRERIPKSLLSQNWTSNDR